MEHNRLKIVALVCAVLLLLGWFGATALIRDESQQWEHQEGGSIILSEILPANRTCPAPDGRLLDFIEIHNLSGSPVDISGHMLGDDLSSIGYTFPEGSVISGYGFLVCWCDKDSESDRYAKFGISRTGGDTIYLYNAANVLVDEKVVPQLAGNSALIRVEDKTWQVSLQPTPGFENSDAGYEKWLRSTGIDQMQVVITEVMTSSSCTAVEGIVCDWIELTNNGNQEAVLTGSAEKNITMTQDPALHATDLYDLVKYCESHDLTVQEYYDYVAARLDLASFIDWLILEGYCCNSDVAGNVIWFRSAEMGDLWQPVLQDLDNGFYYRDGFQNVLNPDSPQQYTVMATALMKNEAFRARFLKRLQYALNGPLSDENVLAQIDTLEALLTPEISRERQLWGGSVENWKADISRLRSYLTRYDHTGMLVQSLRQTIALTDEEAKTYFGR